MKQSAMKFAGTILLGSTNICHPPLGAEENFMNVIEFEYRNYVKHVASTEAGEKRKRSAQVAGKKTSKKVAYDETEENDSGYEEESPSGKTVSPKKKGQNFCEEGSGHTRSGDRERYHHFVIRLDNDP